VFGIAPPGAQAFFMLELDDGYTLAVVSEKAFVRNVARPSITISSVLTAG
jgi:hypothetical protein